MAHKPNFPFGSTMPKIAVIRYTNNKWQKAKLVSRKQMKNSLPCHSVHYGEGGFEGARGVLNVQGRILFFRPELNYKRLIGSMERQGFPAIPEEMYNGAIKMVAQEYAKSIFKKPGDSIYIRPLFYCPNDQGYGVLGNDDFVFTVGVCTLDTDNSYKIKVTVEEKDRRAFEGGTGAFKLSCNYAIARRALKKAVSKGFNDVVFLSQKKLVEELSSKNIWWEEKDGTLCTPSLERGTILPGITRLSIVELMKQNGKKVKFVNITIKKLCGKISRGEVIRVFSSGTAITLAEITVINYKGKAYIPKKAGKGGIIQTLYNSLTDCYMGKRNRPWTQELFFLN